MPYKDRKVALNYWRDYNKKHKNKIRKRIAELRLKFPEQYILNRARHRAKYKQLPFDIELKDIKIPRYCPILGLKLDLKAKGESHPFDNSPSIDAIIPKLGYIKGNIAIISFRANRIKSDATSKEILKVGKWLKKKEKVG